MLRVETKMVGWALFLLGIAVAAGSSSGDALAGDEASLAAPSRPTVTVSTGRKHNVFAAATPPRFEIKISKAGQQVVDALLTYEIEDALGEPLLRNQRSLSFAQTHTETIKVDPPKFGVYRMKIHIAFGNDTAFAYASRFSYVVPLSPYTRPQMIASPYGIRVRGEIEEVGAEDIAQSGVVWMRDEKGAFHPSSRAINIAATAAPMAGAEAQPPPQHDEPPRLDDLGVTSVSLRGVTRPPELSMHVDEAGSADGASVLMFDYLRELVASQEAGGNTRSVWVGDFGWDTVAGSAASEHVQAAYLQRGYLLGLMAGVDRLFWKCVRDAATNDGMEADGSGMFSARGEPKPASVAMAAMVNFLRNPVPVGTFDVGPNTSGYVFRDRGRYIGCMFQVDPDLPQLTLKIKQSRLYDMYGNAITSQAVDIGVAPIWITGVRLSSPTYAETAFDLASRYYDVVTPGDTYTIQLRATHNRGTGPIPITALFKVDAPDDCTVDFDSPAVFVAPGSVETIPIQVTVSPTAPAGNREIIVRVNDAKRLKELKTTLRVR